ncbi:MAG TPA: TadE/TadG family type IV pilus assembly protein [Dehalococcoidia bacterium]|nr:TadE/TadG family type IV pilus assembly protein [Dehalococcoidia bacterium]
MEKLRRAHGGEHAQSLVEIAIVLPIFVFLVFGIIDFGMGLRTYISVAQATREGARLGVVGNAAGTFTTGGSGDCNGTTTTTVVGKVCATLNGLDLTKVTSVSVAYPNGNSSGNSVRVTATYSYQYITPIQRLVGFFSGGTLGGAIPISSTTDMRIE